MPAEEGWVGQWCMGRLVTSNWSAHLIVDPSRLLDYSRQGSRLLATASCRAELNIVTTFLQETRLQL